MDWRDDKLIIWLRFDQLKEFIELLGPRHFDGGGMEVHHKSNCIAFDLSEICEDWGIDPERILMEKS